jgi:SAM-dependent methyltransferase
MPSVLWQPHPPARRTLAELPRDSLILDVGSGGRLLAPYVIGVDFLPFENTRVLSDIHQLAFADASVDAIFCTGTLEHIAEPARAMCEFLRILKPDGTLHLEVPFIQPYHADPEDFWRWTLPGLRLFARQHGFIEVRSGSHLRSTSAMNALIISYFQSWFKNRYIRKAIDFGLSLIIWPLRYADALAGDDTVDVPSAVYFVGRKAGTMVENTVKCTSAIASVSPRCQRISTRELTA